MGEVYTVVCPEQVLFALFITFLYIEVMKNKETKKLKVISELLKHGNISRACKRADLHRQTFYSWLESDTDFYSQVTEARADALA